MPGPTASYSHDIPRAEVERYVRAAHRNHALLLLDLQPGRSGFLETAKRWAWALRDPWVGLALDPEWRMGPHQVPAHTVGQVSAAEVNRTSAWLARLTRRADLPEKLFVLHQFRTDMVLGIDRVRDRADLAMVQHVDGYGTPQQKLATYHAVARPQQFTMGFKLFYDEDVRRMSARDGARHPAAGAVRQLPVIVKDARWVSPGSSTIRSTPGVERIGRAGHRLDRQRLALAALDGVAGEDVQPVDALVRRSR